MMHGHNCDACGTPYVCDLDDDCSGPRVCDVCEARCGAADALAAALRAAGTAVRQRASDARRQREHRACSRNLTWRYRTAY